MDRTLQRGPEEIAEIERHKYFLSEKAGHDVGWEVAEQDWEEKYAEEFHRVHEQTGDVHDQDPDDSASPTFGGFFKRLISRTAR